MKGSEEQVVDYNQGEDVGYEEIRLHLSLYMPMRTERLSVTVRGVCVC